MAGRLAGRYSSMRVLTVGDGDLSCSLALARAYCCGGGANDVDGDAVVIDRLVATTLLKSRQELVETYPESAARNVDELLLHSNRCGDDDSAVVSIVYGVDATRLHVDERIVGADDKLHEPLLFDCVLFHHPHLGYHCHHHHPRRRRRQQDDKGEEEEEIENDGDENEIEIQQANDHACLLAHYLHSASKVVVRRRRRGPSGSGDGDDSDNSRTEKGSAAVAAAAAAETDDEKAGDGDGGGDDDDDSYGFGFGGGGGGGGCVHLCLCGNQHHTWRLRETALRLGLEECPGLSPRPASKPIFPQPQGRRRRERHRELERGTGSSAATRIGGEEATAAATAPRKFRNGNRKLGSRHWLGKYGYRHQPTHPRRESKSSSSSKHTNVSNSQHYFFRVRSERRSAPRDNGDANTATYQVSSEIDTDKKRFMCEICMRTFDDADSLDAHLRAPALPGAAGADVTAFRGQKGFGSAKGSGSATNGQRQSQVSKEGAEANDAANQSAVEASTTPQREEGRREPADVLAESSSITSAAIAAAGATAAAFAVVESALDGKRLRWYLQHVVKLGSKRLCERLVVQHLAVQVNGEVAKDSGRILRTGDRVLVLTTPEEEATQQPPNNNQQQRSTKEEGRIRVVESWIISNATSAFADTAPCHEESKAADAAVAAVVVYKPVGMPVTDGSYPNPLHPSNRSLEGYFSRQRGAAFFSRSRLDRGCGGLVVLTGCRSRHDSDVGNGGAAVPGKKSPARTPSIHLSGVTRVFVALVHGRVPDEWGVAEKEGGTDDEGGAYRGESKGITVRLPVEGLRRWKKKPKTSDEMRSTQNDDDGPCANSSMAKLFVLEKTITATPPAGGGELSSSASSMPALSTVMIRTNSPASSLVNVICFYLRKEAGYPVVGDRFATAEYQALPRSVRNRLKQHLCIGCVKLEAGSNDNDDKTDHVAEDRIPDKWRASYWEEHCLNK